MNRRTLRLAMFALVLLMLPSAGASAAATSYAPLWVVAETIGPAKTLVEWAPGAEQADAYRVYGVRGTTLTLLVETAGTAIPLTTLLSAGYDTYAVSGMKGGVESAPVFALKHFPVWCVVITTTPPEAGLKECESRRALPAEVRDVPVL